ncbi:unnamed protein product [Rhodiola kirilowii]
MNTGLAITWVPKHKRTNKLTAAKGTAIVYQQFKHKVSKIGSKSPTGLRFHMGLLKSKRAQFQFAVNCEVHALTLC